MQLTIIEHDSDKNNIYKTAIRPAMTYDGECFSTETSLCLGQPRLNSISHAVQNQHGQQLIAVAHQSNCSVIAKVVPRAVKLVKRQASAALLQPVVMEGESLETVYQFDYLGCRFTSDGDDAADMRHRMAIAGERSRRLDYLWHDNRLPRSLKLRLYAASVCSTLTHGSEAWILTPRALATLNGFNSRQLHRIPGRSYREEATTPSYDLLTAVRTRRHQWLGHILRMPANRLVRRAVLALGQRAGPPYQPGSILMDAPFPPDELVLRAADRRGWARDTRSLSSLQESP